MRPSAAASLATPGGEASAPASTANPTPSRWRGHRREHRNTGHGTRRRRPPQPSAPTTAALEVRSDPAGAHVTHRRRRSRAHAARRLGAGAGRRQVRVSGPFPTIIRHITLAAGQQGAIERRAARCPTSDRSSAAPASTGDSGAAAQVAAGGAGARPAPVGRGWLTIDSPLVLRVVRNGDFLGTSEDAASRCPRARTRSRSRTRA